MRKVAKLLADRLRRVYFRLARPALNLAREEREREYRQLRLEMKQELTAVCAAVRAEADELARGRQEVLDHVRAKLDQARAELEQVRAERRELREEVRAELDKMNLAFVEYYSVLTQKVADELTKMNRRLETPARAA
jgi:uncharacterized coiled-coil DUF342 family protein